MARGSDPETLKRLAREIQEKRELTRALSLAGRRQRYMLPREVNIAGYEVASVYLPCSEVSGDFFDILELDAENSAFFIGDVAGHGIEAALVMGMAKKTIAIYSRLHRLPAEVLSRSNDELAGDLDAETFVTALYCLLEVSTGRLRLARAGHPKPVLYNTRRSPRWAYLEARGLVMGMTHGATYRRSLAEAEVLLEPGDFLLLYTDGLVEGHDRNKVAFGADRMLEVVEKHGKSQPSELIAALLQRVEEFLAGQEPQDDITIIALHRLAR